MNPIKNLFETKKDKLVVYFTAGYPQLDDTIPIIKALDAAGVDLIEIGIPYADPLADGPVIQNSNRIALNNGMKLSHLFHQLKDLRKHTARPVVLMCYLNNIIQYGAEKFCKTAAELGINGIIVPDLPVSVYKEQFQKHFADNKLVCPFLVTARSPESRIREIDQLNCGFIYLVSQSQITGGALSGDADLINYLKRIRKMELQTPQLLGFGIRDNASYTLANDFTDGAIIGSAFIQSLDKASDLYEQISQFIKHIKSTQHDHSNSQ